MLENGCVLSVLTSVSYKLFYLDHSLIPSCTSPPDLLS